MNKKIVQWLSHYNIYQLDNKNVIAIGADQEYFFCRVAFPLFYLINGKRTIEEITDKADNKLQAMQFTRLCNSLINRGEFLQIEDSASVTQKIECTTTLHGKNVWSYLPNNSPLLQELSKFIDKVCIPTFFTHDLLNSSFKQSVTMSIGEESKFQIVSLGVNKLTLSPLLNNIDELDGLLAHLKANKPVLNSLEKSLRTPIERPVCSQFNLEMCCNTLETLIGCINDESQRREKYLIEIDFSSQKTTKHFASYPIKRTASNSSNEIILHAKKISHDLDGGSRTLNAQETINNLSPYISQLIGPIAYFEELDTSASPIKIFKAAFFKSPYFIDEIDLDHNSFVQICLGKGVSKEQSLASALCETIERKNAQFTNQISTTYCTPSELDKRFYSFQELSPYSKEQYSNFADQTHTDARRKQACSAYLNDHIHWQGVWSLTHKEQIYVPSVICFANTPYREEKYGKWQSNGCAAGNNLEEAIMQGLFELIERDAAAIWWYNRLQRPSFDLSRLDPKYFSPLHQTLCVDHEYWVLDLTTDTSIPVMAAIGRHKVTAGWVFGFGCHLKPELAAQRALTELCQLIPIRDQNGAPFDFDAIEKEDFLIPNSNASAICPKLEPSGDLKLDILAVVEQLKSLGMETLALDYSQEPIPIKTAKVFVPGLCHIWPQLGNPRLFDTPVKLGLRDEQLNENTINQQGLYI
ncbi:YcaO-like family protein [Pseudoalteromonas luteoviolacea]|uniref:YcaO domain-containing protein n=1 Tax=Pseudoalteromonas luteoviolacea NCIMB 1942 TaxID=1365253 RepID=A0A166XN32_9GAMM|nr:YcaO-like family protein [Pseudoalteromonas luteoviolacea]KZN40618.1 hypothetical protein N482_21045 [Pseudoalteromonas luteoviolacea NCIMB 1942]